MLSISDERLKHSLEVARLMKELAEGAGWNKQKCEEMFVLGLLHDIGYESAEQQCEHAGLGGEMLKNQGYKYWKEVSCHGKLDAEYSSEELTILNIADVSVDSTGKKVGVSARLSDIASRYGVDSKQYIEAEQLARKIGLLK